MQISFLNFSFSFLVVLKKRSEEGKKLKEFFRLFHFETFDTLKIKRFLNEKKVFSSSLMLEDNKSRRERWKERDGKDKKRISKWFCCFLEVK